MNSKYNPAPNFEGFQNQNSPWSSDAGLAVTVISTTEKGTVAALKAASCLATDLDATITLLNLEMVPPRFPLYRPHVSLKYKINQQRSMLHRSGASETDVDLKIRFCRDWNSGLQWVLRRRSLVVIGGNRRWWVSREERLERVLLGLGHHVIFIDVAQEQNKTPQSSHLPFSLGRNQVHIYGLKSTARLFFGVRARKEIIP